MDAKFLEIVRQFAIKHMRLEGDSIHGIQHWERVANFGACLNVPEADSDVVLCFAYLHDVERQDDGYDVEHGPRAAALINEIRGSVLSFLDDKQIALLREACALHTVCHRTGNPTIDACFDSDRLDLGRVGISPDPEKMATAEGAARARKIQSFYNSIESDNSKF